MSTIRIGADREICSRHNQSVPRIASRGGFEPAQVGLEPDSAVLGRARAKEAAAGVAPLFVEVFMSEEGLSRLKPLSKITSSLVPLSEKRRMLSLMRRAIAEGGSVHIADYGEQRAGLSRWLFRHTVQSLDGVEDTQPNADGILPVLMREVGGRPCGRDAARINAHGRNLELSRSRRLRARSNAVVECDDRHLVTPCRLDLDLDLVVVRALKREIAAESDGLGDLHGL